VPILSVVNPEIVPRVEGWFALADPLEVRLARAPGQVDRVMRLMWRMPL